METPLPLTPAAPLSDTEDAHKIGHKGSRSQRIEVITRDERRRVWTPEQKREIVAESFGPDLTPTEVVRKHGISSGQLYTWRQRLLSGPMTVLSRSAPGFAQVNTMPARQPPDASDPQLTGPVAAPGALSPSSGMIEIVLTSGVSLRVDAHVDGRALRRVLEALTAQ
jgi:transposase